MRNLVVCHRRVQAREGVREIPISSISITGAVLGGEFESTLERDLILLQAWDSTVDWFQTQPLKIKYEDSTGRSRAYTPDLLVSFDPCLSKGRRPMLCEVKPREVLLREGEELLPRFRAARRTATERGWDFRIFDETRIRTPYLHNVQFLWRYRHSEVHENIWLEVMEAMQNYDKVTMRMAIDNHFDGLVDKGQAIWSFWVLVARQLIEFDMREKITPSTLFWVSPMWRGVKVSRAIGPT